MGLPLWMPDVPEYFVDNKGTMHITMGGFALAMPAEVFETGCAKGMAQVAAWRRTMRTGQVLEFPRH